MPLPIELEQEADGRWFGTIPDLPGVMAYGTTPEEAATSTRVLAMKVLTERVEHGEDVPESVIEFFAVRS